MKVYKFSDIVKMIKLYIPHGSDESHATVYLNDLQRFFISHMVQMKV